MSGHSSPVRTLFTLIFAALLFGAAQRTDEPARQSSGPAAASAAIAGQPILGRPVGFAVSIPVRDLPEGTQPAPGPVPEIVSKRRELPIAQGATTGSTRDEAIQTFAMPLMPVPMQEARSIGGQSPRSRSTQSRLKGVTR